MRPRILGLLLVLSGCSSEVPSGTPIAEAHTEANAEVLPPVRGELELVDSAEGLLEPDLFGPAPRGGEDDCALVGESETIFTFDESFGYILLGDQERDVALRLVDRTEQADTLRRFESLDGIVVATFALSESEASRGRGFGPGTVGELAVTFDGNPVEYPYPSRRQIVHGPVLCGDE